MVELPLAGLGGRRQGTRLDHVWVSPTLDGARESDACVRDARGWERPSDHAPVKVELAL